MGACAHTYSPLVLYGQREPKVYADSSDGAPFRQEMARADQGLANSPRYVYWALIFTNRSASDSTPRVIPYYSAATRLEIDRIVWQR